MWVLVYKILNNFFNGGQYKYLSNLDGTEEAKEIWNKSTNEKRDLEAKIIQTITPFVQKMLETGEKVSRTESPTEYSVLRSFFSDINYEYISIIEGIDDARKIWEKTKDKKKSPEEIKIMITPFVQKMIQTGMMFSYSEFPVEARILNKFFNGIQYKYLSELPRIEEAREIWEKRK
jgi:hypothetical protein